MKITTLICVISIMFMTQIANGQNELNQLDREGRKNGLWVTTNSAGNINSIEDYSNGVKDGLFLAFSDRGEIITDTIFNMGVIDSFTIDSQSFKFIIKTDTLHPSFCGRLVYTRSVNGEDENFMTFKNGKGHGLYIWHRMTYHNKKIEILYHGIAYYMILTDQNYKPITYYSYWGRNRPYTINSCLTAKNLLTLEISNDNNYPVIIPSLKSRTLMYVPTKGELFHELYFIMRDTLFVNLNHGHPPNRFYTVGINGGIRFLEKRQMYFDFQRFSENILQPNSSKKQKVKIHLFDTHIEYIVLIIENERYMIRNHDFSQSPIQVTPNVSKFGAPIHYYFGNFISDGLELNDCFLQNE